MEAQRSARRELHELVDLLPEAETHAARRYLEYLRDRGLPGLAGLLDAGEEDEELSPEGQRLLEQGLADVRAERTVSGEDARRELGW